MNTQPLLTIGAIFTSLKVAVVAIITVVALSAGWDEAMTAAVVGAGAAITLAIGDIIAYALTWNRVSPIEEDE